MDIIPLALVLLMALVIFYDASRYIIPNWLVGLVAGLYVPFALLAPATPDWMMALAAFAGFFVLGYALFSFRFIGGGDAKLLAACGLWTGTAAALEFLIYMTLFGGVLSLLLVALRPLAGRIPRALPKILQKGAPVPYGLAIAAALLVLLVQGRLPGIALAL